MKQFSEELNPNTSEKTGYLAVTYVCEILAAEWKTSNLLSQISD